MGLNTGGPLITPAEDNEKGFFERIDVVLQNDNFMKVQKIHYGWKTDSYDHQKALQDIVFATAALNTLNAGGIIDASNPMKNDPKFFNEGKRALKFLNDEVNFPWMLKDPRLCITLRTWLPLLKFIPTILFTYRHPLDVALSLKKREYEQYTIAYSLRLWYVYNRMAIEQSNDLCRVVSSNHNLMTSPEREFNEVIFTELKNCGLDVPRKLTTSDITSFIDPNLQHGKSSLKDVSSCQSEISTLIPPATWDTNDVEDIRLYRECMRLYCAMEDRTAFKHNFKFDLNIHNI
jgi:hypothetical protein